jgi:tRNA G18 (ribose-2'-O)-methylase SpoU
MTVSYESPLCLVIGNEATGIAKSLLSYGTQVTLAQRTADISYNASVAAGILLFVISDKLGIVR